MAEEVEKAAGSRCGVTCGGALSVSTRGPNQAQGSRGVSFLLPEALTMVSGMALPTEESPGGTGHLPRGGTTGTPAGRWGTLGTVGEEAPKVARHGRKGWLLKGRSG